MSKTGLPHFAAGIVIKGFGRGSKELGIPTANFGPEVVNNLPAGIDTGVYYGWASVNSGPVYKMVMSVGWNPYYNNVQKSMETHIMHKFDSEFYGKTLRVCILGYMRPETNFNSLEDLITAIKNDINKAEVELETPDAKQYQHHSFFSEVNGAQE